MIYLDNNATTLIDPEVAEVIKSHTELMLGNASSLHSSGRKARALLVEARQTIASLLCVTSEQLCFTSSATEAMNLLLNVKRTPKHIISSSLEHAATLSALQRLETKGSRISYLAPLEGSGSITANQIESEIRDDTELLVIMGANNETGIKNDLSSIAALAERVGIPLVVDGVALFGKEPFTLPSGVHGFCFSGHKIHGPKGIALAVIRNGYSVEPLIVGGPQQFMRRAGTEDVVAIVAFAKAVALAIEKSAESQIRMAFLRDQFEAALVERLPNVLIHGRDESRVANVSNISFLGIDGESLVITLDLAGVAVSHGSACSSGALEPSHVLSSMGLSREAVRGAIRFSLSRFTTEEEISRALILVVEQVKRLLVGTAL